MLELFLFAGLMGLLPCLSGNNNSEKKADNSRQTTTIGDLEVYGYDYPIHNFKKKKNREILEFESQGYDPIRDVWWKKRDKWEIERF